MSVITIARQYGSLGDDIARDVADRLQLRLVDQEIINSVAERLGVPASSVAERDERESTIVAELVRTMRRLYPATIAPQPPSNGTEIDEAAYLQVIRQVIWEVARSDDAVIVGRGAAFILEKNPDVLHTLLTAPLDVRIERIMAAESLDYDHAAQRIKQADTSRARYIRHFYRTDWLNVAHYDLVVDTGHFSQARATELICAAASDPEGVP